MINSITYLATHQTTHYAPNDHYANENDENDEFHSLYCYLCTFFSPSGRGYFLSMVSSMMPPFFFVKKLFFLILYSSLFSLVIFIYFSRLLFLPLNVSFFFLIQRISDFGVWFLSPFFLSSRPFSLRLHILLTHQSGISLFDNQLSLPQRHALCIVPLLVYLSVLLSPIQISFLHPFYRIQRLFLFFPLLVLSD